MAVCLQVCMCTHMHTDSFKDIYISLLDVASRAAGDVVGIGYYSNDCVQ